MDYREPDGKRIVAKIKQEIWNIHQLNEIWHESLGALLSEIEMEFAAEKKYGGPVVTQ